MLLTRSNFRKCCMTIFFYATTWICAQNINFLWGSWQEQNGSILIKSSFVVVMSPFAVVDESKVKPTDTDESKKIENNGWFIIQEITDQNIFCKCFHSPYYFFSLVFSVCVLLNLHYKGLFPVKHLKTLLKSAFKPWNWNLFLNTPLH